MKINFKNLGPIDSAEVHLNDLTIITGENNSGKTYLTYSIYFLLDFFNKFSISYLKKNNHPSVSNFIDKTVTALYRKKDIRIELSVLQDVFMDYISYLCSIFRDQISDLFKVEASYFKDMECDIGIDVKLIRKISLKQNPNIEISSKSDNDFIIFHITSNELNRQQIKDGVEFFVDACVQESFSDLFVITAERLGIVLFKNELNARRSLVIEQLQKSTVKQTAFPKEFLFDLVKEFTSRYSASIHDNIDYVSEKFPSNSKIGELEKEFSLAKRIEKIMGGRLAYDSSSHEMRFISNKRKDRVDIPLHFASTSIRSLSLLFHYLKYNAKKGDLLIIDEPESHLSLGNQVKLARIVGLCINSGLKILLTTHSDFLLKEINNLIMLGYLKESVPDLKSEGLGVYDFDDALQCERVVAYNVDSGKLKKCKVDKFGIDNQLVEKTISEINENSYKLENLIYQFGNGKYHE
jgi:predicted ATPase